MQIHQQWCYRTLILLVEHDRIAWVYAMYSETKAALRARVIRAYVLIDKKHNGISTKGMSSIVITDTPCPTGGCVLSVPCPCFPES